jgi:glutathione S-transferase
MKLYLSPGACSLADHIALEEGEFQFDSIKVDLKAKKTERGEDYTTINPKGYVPALILDNGEPLTENIAILTWIADQRPALAPKSDALSRYRLLEMLAFISTELHKQFKPFFGGGSDEAKEVARQTIAKRLEFLKGKVKGDYLFGDMSVADCYLFTMLSWANAPGVAVKHGLDSYFAKIKARPAVQKAMKDEGLT